MDKKDFSEISKIQYINPTPDEIPIMAITVWFDDATAIPKEVFQAVRKCGFNLANCLMSESKIEETLNNAHTAGIRVFLQNANLYNEHAPNFVKIHKDNPGLGGWFLADEPSYDALIDTENKELIKEETNEPYTEYCLQNRFKRIWDEDKTHLIFINLIGGLKGHDVWGHPYEKYLQAYQDNFGPMLWSYDVYPIRQINYLLYEDKDKTNGSVIVDLEKFYEDLEIFSTKAKQTDVPFWAYCQGMEFLANQNLYRPMALEQYLRFEAFSALAYGAQGLVYWTYRCRNFGSIDDKDNITFGTELYLSALKSRADKTLPYWYYARQVNSEIRRYQDVFLGAKLVAAYHTNTIYSELSQYMPSPFGPFQKITAWGVGVLVTHLKNDGNDYFVIVNHDPNNSQELDIYFRENVEVRELTPLYSNGPEPGDLSFDEKGITRNLIPGGYLIMQWYASQR